MEIRRVIRLAPGVRSRPLRYGAVGVISALIVALAASGSAFAGQASATSKRQAASSAQQTLPPGPSARSPATAETRSDPADRARLIDVMGVAANIQPWSGRNGWRLPHGLPGLDAGQLLPDRWSVEHRRQALHPGLARSGDYQFASQRNARYRRPAPVLPRRAVLHVLYRVQRHVRRH